MKICLTGNKPIFLFPVRRDLQHLAVYRAHRRQRVVCAHNQPLGWLVTFWDGTYNVPADYLAKLYGGFTHEILILLAP